MIRVAPYIAPHDIQCPLLQVEYDLFVMLVSSNSCSRIHAARARFQQLFIKET